MEKNILLLCAGYLFTTDSGFGHHVAKALQKMKLPDNVEFMDVGESACMIPSVIEGKDKLVVVDVFKTGDPAGTVLRLKPEDVPVTVNGKTDVAKLHLMDTLNGIRLTGKCPETIFVGVVPEDTKTESEELTGKVKEKIPEVIEMILKEIDTLPSR
jgi:hydrogenase maturation protease